ncbi:TIGR01777 family oxidoreductase [Massilia sp. G4R7]|uniref:TIGR01777 family oxidoreductase n=1 Tax=Massilia phyllostachyos TaxID=2898585 RepID=A0ABS8Q2Z1_9BURK|nr:TIGR01777 family oxidoreductase [Massilia phyllostachyos]MCD2516113.1 TIGR01777 family oxidoreductase [Massilia phyllostachyos]
MNTHLLALQLMAVQGCLGAFDTLYHHEFAEALPQRPGARRELGIHALRAAIYGLLFVGLAGWEWHGLWAGVLAAAFALEIGLTLWDFVVEDRSRLLPASERVTHTVLAINGGAFIALLALQLPAWAAQPSGFAWQPQGWLSVFLALCGAGVVLSGLRDLLAMRRLGRLGAPAPAEAVRFDTTPRTVLVTGATGFVGQHLVRALLADGHAVIALSRQPRQAAWLFEGRVRCIAALDELGPGTPVDVVVNLAGARILGPRWSARRQAVLRRSRVALTQALADWIGTLESKPFLLLSASAIGYYGIQRIGDDTPLDEAAPPQPVFMSALCREWEDAAGAAARQGTRVETMRFGLVLGMGGALPMMLLPVLLGLGGPLGGGRQWLSWIHVDDVVRAMAHRWRRAAARRDPPVGASNFTAPEAVTQKQFSRTAARVWRRPSFVPTPGWPMRLAMGEQADLLLEGQRVAPTRLEREGFVFRYPRLEAALRSLK